MADQLYKDAQQFGESNSQYAYRTLYYNIMHLKMLPGYVLNESFLTDFFGFSRTPIREAVFRLKEDRLVEVYAKNKTIVSYIDAGLLREGYLIRTAVETKVMQELCENFPEEYKSRVEENLKIQKLLSTDESLDERFHEYDNEFHNLLFEAADMSWSWQTMKRACSHLDRARFINLLEPELNLPQRRSSRDRYLEHEKMYRTILEKRPNDIGELVSGHLNKKLLDEWQTPSPAMRKYTG